MKKQSRKNNTFSCPKWVAVVTAVCAALLLANTITHAVLDMSIFSISVELIEYVFSVDFDAQEPEPVYLPTSEDDPYGFKGKLAKYGINFETPHYIPDGFVLTEVSTHVNESYANIVRFIFWKGKQNFSLDYEMFFYEVGNPTIPSDHYNFSETEVNGSPAIVSKEDNQYTITYLKGKTVFFMFAQDVPYDECEKIVASIE